MIEAPRAANLLLMTANRLHFEEGNLQAIDAIRSRAIGEPQLYNAIHTMQVAPVNIRIDRSLDGEPLKDIGIYCINAARLANRPWDGSELGN